MPACRNAYLWEAFRLRQALRRAGTLPLAFLCVARRQVARNDNVIVISYWALQDGAGER